MSTVSRIASINGADKHLKNNNSEEFQEDNTELDELDKDAEDEIEQDEDVTNKEAKPEDEVDILPKFKGKTPAEISKAYAELEREHGRLANEVGDYRKMAREYLFNDQGSNKGKEKASRTLTDEDFIDKPSEAVSGLVEDKIDPVMKKLDKVEMSLRVAEFQRTNPDFHEIVTSPEFSEWVKASPYRTRLFQKADAADLDAGTELLQGYREYRDASKASREAAEKALGKEKTLRKVSSEKSGSAGSSGKKKIWSSAYLINLKITNPEKYNSLMPEIMQAYQEGRVK